MRMRKKERGRWRGGETGNHFGQEREEGASFSSAASSKPSRAKKRNGRKTAFIKLSADARPCLRRFCARFSPSFHPARATNSAPQPPQLSVPHRLARLFRVRNSWPPLPPWNEVGMCKIVPRYALHHRVASSRSLYFLLSLSLALLFISSPHPSISFLDLFPWCSFRRSCSFSIFTPFLSFFHFSLSLCSLSLSPSFHNLALSSKFISFFRTFAFYSFALFDVSHFICVCLSSFAKEVLYQLRSYKNACTLGVSSCTNTIMRHAWDFIGLNSDFSRPRESSSAKAAGSIDRSASANDEYVSDCVSHCVSPVSSALRCVPAMVSRKAGARDN